MCDQLYWHDRKPEVLYADGQYGSDEKVTHAAQRGVDLQSPGSGAPQQNSDDLSIDDLVVDEQTQTVACCPNGHEPISSVHDADKGRTRTVMEPSPGSACRHQDKGPVRTVGDGTVIEHTRAEHPTAPR